MISRITMSTLAAAVLALGVSGGSAQAAPATGAVGAGVKTAALNGAVPGEGAQQVHWRRHHHWRGYRDWGYRRHYWRRWW